MINNGMEIRSLKRFASLVRILVYLIPPKAFNNLSQPFTIIHLDSGSEHQANNQVKSNPVAVYGVSFQRKLIFGNQFMRPENRLSVQRYIVH